MSCRFFEGRVWNFLCRTYRSGYLMDWNDIRVPDKPKEKRQEEDHFGWKNDGGRLFWTKKYPSSPSINFTITKRWMKCAFLSKKVPAPSFLSWKKVSAPSFFLPQKSSPIHFFFQKKSLPCHSFFQKSLCPIISSLKKVSDPSSPWWKSLYPQIWVVKSLPCHLISWSVHPLISLQEEVSILSFYIMKEFSSEKSKIFLSTVWENCYLIIY